MTNIETLLSLGIVNDKINGQLSYEYVDSTGFKSTRAFYYTTPPRCYPNLVMSEIVNGAKDVNSLLKFGELASETRVVIEKMSGLLLMCRIGTN